MKGSAAGGGVLGAGVDGCLKPALLPIACLASVGS